MQREYMMPSHFGYDEMLEIFMPSKEMREYLKDKTLSLHCIKKLIIGAPTALDAKYSWVERLIDGVGNTLNSDDWDLSDLKETRNRIKAALNHLNSVSRSEVLSLEECWYDYDIHEHKSYMDYLFKDFDSALAFIRREENGEEYASDKDGRYIDDEGNVVLLWWKLIKWIPDSRGRLCRKYAYYLLHDEVIWFEQEYGSCCGGKEGHRPGNRDFLDSSCLELPLPYQPGDIIAVDTYPFGPCQPAVVICKSDHNDYLCCLLKDESGLWIESNVMHGHLGRSVYQEDYISVLYSIRKWSTELKDDEYVLFNAVSKALNGSNNKGEKLFDLMTARQFETERLLQVIRSM